jgi:DNA-binding transcriptional regulator YiaG
MEMMDNLIFFRQCVDLLSEPAALHIPPGTLLGEAYDKFLAPEYSRLVQGFFYLPRIALSDSDNPELVCNLLNAINERFIVLLGNEALRRGQKRSSAWRVYARCLLESADLVFRKMMRFKLDSGRLSDLDWLRYCVTDADAIIEFLEDRANTSPVERLKKDLTETETSVRDIDVKAQLPILLERLKTAAEKSGKKSKLAEFLDVPLASVSRWLSGEREPGGEITLKLLRWVEQQERQK